MSDLSLIEAYRAADNESKQGASCHRYLLEVPFSDSKKASELYSEIYKEIEVIQKMQPLSYHNMWVDLESWAESSLWIVFGNKDQQTAAFQVLEKNVNRSLIKFSNISASSDALQKIEKPRALVA